jgi:hypothetical protein
VKQLLADDIGKRHFSKYSEKEFSLENVLAYCDVEQLVQNAQNETFQTLLMQFDTNYMQYMSSRALNVPSGISADFNSLLRGDDVDKIAILQDIRGAAMTNLLDTFGRYKVTPYYKECLAEMNLRKDLENAIEKNG